MATFNEGQSVTTTEELTATLRTGGDIITLVVATGTAGTIIAPNLLPESMDVELAEVEFTLDLTAVQMKIKTRVVTDKLAAV